MKLWKRLIDSHSTACPDLGSDHRAVRASLRILCTEAKKQRSNKQTRKAPTHQTKWPPEDLDDFKTYLTNKLDNIVLTNNLDERCRQIEEALRDATKLNEATTRHMKRNNERHNLTQLIQQRRELTNNDPHRKTISKQINKEIKAVKKIERQAQIEKILEEFKGLKQISGIKSRKEKPLITSMTSENGTETNDRQSIADVFCQILRRPIPATTTQPTRRSPVRPPARPLLLKRRQRTRRQPDNHTTFHS